MTHSNKTRRIWLPIIAVLTLASGWIGVAVNAALGEPQGVDSLGTLIWITTPVLLVLFIRFTRRAESPGRWRPRLKQNWPWYLLAIAVFPALSVIGIALGAVTGGSLAGMQIGTLIGAGAVALGPALVKNVAEEVVWRGYFVGTFEARGWNDWAIYTISGAVWALWHAPYYLFFLPEDQVRAVTDLPRWGFALLASVVLLLWSVLFAEVFRLTRSIWPAVILHAVGNSTINPLIIEGHLTLAPGTEWLVSPVIGLVPSLLIAGLGLWLRKVRRQREHARKDTAQTQSMRAEDKELIGATASQMP